jgi:hypothetical protein
MEVVYMALGHTFEKPLLTLFRPNIQNFIQNTPTSSRKTPIFSFFFSFQTPKFIILTSKSPSSTSDRFHPFYTKFDNIFLKIRRLPTKIPNFPFQKPEIRRFHLGFTTRLQMAFFGTYSVDFIQNIPFFISKPRNSSF